MDNFGEDLISNPRAGGVYYWDKSDGLNTRSVALSSLTGSNLAPTKGLQVIVSDIDRHAIVLGADPIENGVRSGQIDPLLVAFPIKKTYLIGSQHLLILLVLFGALLDLRLLAR